MKRLYLLGVSVLLIASPACGGDEPEPTAETGESGDGDGDTTGDGDGDPATGDGDGDTTGDGDGDTTGDGDGDTTGDGDGDTPEPSSFWVGIDVRDVDPNQEQLDTIYLGGFDAPLAGGTATGIHDSIYVRSFAVGLGEEGVVFTVVDVTGMGNQITRAIRDQAANLTGLSRDHIIVAATHTHAGPDFQGLWGGIGDSYKQFVINETVGSMLAAWQTRVPANLEVASSSALNRNRRGHEERDDSIFMLQARTLDDDALIGTMAAFAAHPVIIGDSNNDLSRDYCGYAVDALEASTGAPAVLFNGILGDISPDVPEGDYADDFEEAEAYGTYVAEQAVLTLDEREPVDPLLVVDYDEWEMPVDNVLFNLAGQAGLLLYDFDQDFLSGTVLTQSTYVRLGTQAQLVAFPGESLTRNGLPLKQAMQTPYKAVLGNANDALGYFVPGDEWNIGLNDNYEESISVHPTAGDVTRGKILDMIVADVF